MTVAWQRVDRAGFGPLRAWVSVDALHRQLARVSWFIGFASAATAVGRDQAQPFT